MWQFVWQAVKGQLAARDCLGNRHRVERQPSSDDLPTRRRLVLSTRCAGRDIGCDQVWTLPRGSPSKTSLRFGGRHCHVLTTCKMGERDQVARDPMARVYTV